MLLIAEVKLWQEPSTERTSEHFSEVLEELHTIKHTSHEFKTSEGISASQEGISLQSCLLLLLHDLKFS
jgi:hypothetical protein